MARFGSFFNDMEDDPLFGSHMRTMRQMNTMMNSLFTDPFGIMNNDFGDRMLTHRAPAPSMALSPFAMPNMNRLLSGSLDNLGNNSHCYSSSTVVSMVSGPDGRPQVYKASSSTRIAPGGIKETQNTVSDSRTGTKKMAIGHHIGDRAHIIEREQNVHSGDQEERQEFINLDEDDAEGFNHEWETKAKSRNEIGGVSRYRRHHGVHHSGVPAITAGPSRRHRTGSSLVPARRSIRPSLNVSHQSTSSSTSRRPYSPPGSASTTRKNKNIKTVSGSPPPDI
ncbi:myeloid leukemia factor isoform X2 [Onthophagus taurus]|uniref:myeloid leukemia factor isoform X2 n=1 Tax=Onthophagus taurus TaxID=166361 RepID=UPI000C200184|nr:myeloid leukemia factor isoform X2 [Onthophagus taurus]